MASVGGFFKGLGKVALKAAPIAAGFLPGVGPLANLAKMGIGAAAGGASSKLGGGSVLGGALGGASQAGLGSAIKGGIKGIGPSNPTSYVGKDIGKVASAGQGGIPWGKIGMGAGIGGAGLAAGMALGNRNQGQQQGQGIGPSYEGFQNRTPNLENYLSQGRQEGMASQPWRQDRGIFPSMPQGQQPGGMFPNYFPQRQGPQQFNWGPQLQQLMQRGTAAGQDMSWMQQPGGISPEYLQGGGQVPQMPPPQEQGGIGPQNIRTMMPRQPRMY